MKSTRFCGLVLATLLFVPALMAQQALPQAPKPAAAAPVAPAAPQAAPAAPQAVTVVPEKALTPTELALQKADDLFKKQNWADARAAYDAVRDAETDWHSAPTRLAVEGAIAASFQLKLWDDGLARATQYIAKTKGSLEEAIGERFLAGLYLSAPHYGTKRGSTFLRGQYVQGVQVSSWRKDRAQAIQHYERARQLLIALDTTAATAANTTASKERPLVVAERIGVDFDLAGALTQQNRYGYGYGYGRWGWFGWWWGNGEDEEDSDAVEEADYEETRYGRGWGWGYDNDTDQTPPTGIPLGADGRPVFPAIPAAYSPQLGDGPKIRFLLDEVQQLDTSETKDDAARALLRWAMIARSLYGPDSIAQWNSSRTSYDRFGQAVPQQSEDAAPVKKIWELQEDEALTIAGGRLGVVALPPGESPMALLREIERKYPKSTLLPEAHYARALYLQTRQQFPQAIAEYRSLIAAYPQHARANSAKEQIEIIERPEVSLGTSGVALPGGKPRLSFTQRNTGEIDFKATRIDLMKYVQDEMQNTKQDNWNYRNISYRIFEKDRWKDYIGKEAASWRETVNREPDNRVADGATLAPLGDPGAYIVEATVPGNAAVARVLVLVTDIAIIQKNLAGKGLIWIADARSGQPLPGKAVRVYEHWTEYKDDKQTNYVESVVLTTDKNGVIEYKRKHNSNIDAVVNGDARSMAYSFFQNWNESDSGDYQENGSRIYVITDRPVYRPGSTVKFRVWVRQKSEGRFVPSAQGQQTTIGVYDAKNVAVKSLNVTTDEFGGASGEYELGDEPPLGIYHLQVNGYAPNGSTMGGGLFRVEEYKKPEFEVSVQPAKTQARLGEKVRAKIEARYLFGAPVAGATVSYKIFRETYHKIYLGEGEYDWLYGRGYGRYSYAYPWLPWWGYWGRYISGDGWYGNSYPAVYYPWGYYGDGDGYQRRAESGTRKALRDLVGQGQAVLKADGTYEVEIDTARAKAEQGNSDHRYTIEAEVRDASRRTIAGEGSLVVTRQQFSAFVETDGGWYEPKNEAFVQVRTLTPDDVPVAAKGEVVVTRIVNSAGAATREEVVKRWNAETDAEGRLSFKFPIPNEGQYRISFKTRDGWNQEVQGNAVFWVNGPKFDGRVYRFNDLEIIADKRTYKIGETAHLLLNTAEPNSRVLLSTDVSEGTLRSYRFLDIAGNSTVIDIPITAKQVPNFFIEATLVRNGRVHTEAQQMFVPPVQGLLNVKLTSDKTLYKAGEKGHIAVAVTDNDGKPVSGQVTLSAYDQAVTYIQDEFGPSPRVFYYGHKRYHTPQVDASTAETFNSSGSFTRAENMYYAGGASESWSGSWSLESYALSLSGDFYGDSAGGRITALESRAGLRLDYAAGPSGPLGSFAILGNIVGGGFGGVAGKSLIVGYPQAAKVASGLLYDEELSPQPALVEPEIRTNFADTALWLPALNLDKNGTAETDITFPQSLTTWRVRGYAISKGTQVGDATAHATTTKKLLVRLQAPRFFVERDEVVLSANVQNYLATSKAVRAELIVPADLFQYMGDATAPGAGALAPDKDGNLHLPLSTTVKANGEARLDWPVKVLKAGFARITVKALTDEESDGMRLAFPVLVHGVDKTIAQSGSYRVAQEGTRTLKVALPQQVDAARTQLEVTLSPSLAGVMVDALPYLTGYPYGCVEQTMSRFYPSVLVKDTLEKMGTDLETIGKQRRQMNEGDLKNRFGRYGSPVFDSDELDAMVKAGLGHIYNFQHNDGGWGWWREDDSSPYQTAYVLQGLKAAMNAGVAVDRGVYNRGLDYLRNSIQSDLEKAKKTGYDGIGYVDGIQIQTYIAYVLSLEGQLQTDEQRKWLDDLFANRGNLNNYGRSLLALAMNNFGKKDEAKTLLQNVLQFVERDDSNETAWVRTPETGWWFWWNNDIETNAWALRALVTIDPQNDLGPRLVKWLLNNRRNGYYWRSTRDTALVISAMTEFMRATGEAAPDYTLKVNIDGKTAKTVKITKDNFFTFDNRLLLSGVDIKPGPHEITLTKTGKGALYYSTYLSYFTKEEDVKGAGNEIFVERQYFKLVPKTEVVTMPSAGQLGMLPTGQNDPQGSGRKETRDGWNRILLHNGDAVKSGEQIEVVLKITAKNTYDYLAFEDMKPAGCEPVELRSGGRWAGGIVANVELRDEKVVFFIGLLEQGQHILRYKLRAETPGKFHALPTKGFAMYAPEVKGISDEMRLGITD